MTENTAAALFDAAWLERAQRFGADKAEVATFYDGLPTLSVAEMFGRWKGRSLPSGHPLDGWLEQLGWYGKDFEDAETVHPLLFGEESGKLRALDPKRLPIGLAGKLGSRGGKLAAGAFPLVEPLIETQEPAARLRMTEYRGKVSATMIYDAVPINDVFRRFDAERVIGAMDMRGQADPFFFILERVRLETEASSMRVQGQPRE